MAFTFQQLKQAKQNIMDSFGLSAPDASRVVGFFSGSPDTVQAIINNDLAGVPSALSALGLAPQVTAQDQPVQDHAGKQTSQDHATQGTARKAPQASQDQEPQKQCAQDQRKKDQGKAPTSRKRSASSAPIAASAPQAPAVSTALDCPQECAQAPAMAPDVPQGAALDCPDDPHALPAGLYDDICASIDYYCDTHDIKDKQKIHPLQWQGICYRIGETIKARKLLHDFPREKSHGGTVYDGEKVAALLAIYGVICSDYKQVAFTFNFQRFAGISADYLHDYMQHGLSSSRVGLREKALELQKASLVGAVTSGGSATVGNIFLSKALAGLQETVTIQHVSAAAAPQVSALPVFDDGGSLLPDDGGEK